MEYKHFSKADFDDSKVILVPCSIDDIRPSSLARLDRAREIAGIPFRISCAARTYQHEISKGRSGTSSHVVDEATNRKCKAFDIIAADPRSRYTIVKALMDAGFTRIGIYQDNNFIHADDDETKDQEIIW